MTQGIGAHLKNYISNFYKDFSRLPQDAEINDILIGRSNEKDGLYRKLSRICGTLDGKMILDVGCGCGGKTLEMALRGANIIGIEPLIDGIRVCNARSADHPRLKIKFLTSEGERLPFKKETFDMITAFYSLECAKDIDGIIHEVHRVLKKNGLFYCEVQNYLFPKEDHYGIFWFPMMPKPLARLYLRIRKKDPRGLGNFVYTTRRSVLKKLKSCGFTEIRDVNINYVKERIDNPELIINARRRKIMKILKHAGLSGIFAFLIIKIGIYPAVHLSAKKQA